MPSSILKYFDIARRLGAGIKCPLCSSPRCEQSKWRSQHERLSAASYRPYRCASCNYRFLASSSAALEAPLINGAAVVLLVLGALLAFDIWQENVELAQAAQLEAAAKASGEGGTPAGDAAGDGGSNPLLQAAKSSRPAANGDAGLPSAPGQPPAR